MPIAVQPVAAGVTLTSTGAFLNTETVTIGGKVYTFQTVLTNVDGNVLIGANQTASHQNLMDAVNLNPAAGLAGTTYAAAMTKNAQVRATSATGTTTIFQSKVSGTIGNLIPSTETLTNASFGAATLTAGTGDAGQAIADILLTEQPNSSVAQLLKQTF